MNLEVEQSDPGGKTMLPFLLDISTLPRVQSRLRCCLWEFGPMGYVPGEHMNLHALSLRMEPASPLSCENGTCL